MILKEHVETYHKFNKICFDILMKTHHKVSISYSSLGHSITILVYLEDNPTQNYLADFNWYLSFNHDKKDKFDTVYKKLKEILINKKISSSLEIFKGEVI